MKREDIKNNVSYRTVDSNFSYPDDPGTGWYRVCQLDVRDAERILAHHFKTAGIRINNKYVVRVNDNDGQEIFIYNHDGRYYLVNQTQKAVTKEAIAHANAYGDKEEEERERTAFQEAAEDWLNYWKKKEKKKKKKFLISFDQLSLRGG